MTHEMMLQLTGLRSVGSGKSLRGVGMLLGYPVEAFACNFGIDLHFTVGDTKFKLEDFVKKLRTDEQLKDSFGISFDLESRPNVFGLSLKANDENMVKKLFDRMLWHLDEASKELPNFAPPTVCAFCNSAGSDTLVRVNGQLNIVHKTCLEQSIHEAEQAFRDKVDNPNTTRARGLLGGILGGVVGALPAFLIAFFFPYHYAVAVLALIIPLGVATGWRIFGGKVTRSTKVFTLLYSMIVAVFICVFNTFFILRSYGWDVTLAEVIQQFYLDIDGFLEVALYTFLILVFTVLGFGLTLLRGYMKKDAKILAFMQANFEDAVPLDDKPL